MRTIRRFLFVVPNTRWFGKRCWMWFNPGVSLLAPILKSHGYEVGVLEANIDNLGPEDVSRRIREFGPDVVGISNMSLEYWRQLHYCARLTKEVDPNILVLAGGIQVATVRERMMQDPHIDCAVVGEAEQRLPQMLRILTDDKPDLSVMNGLMYRDAQGQTVIKDPVGWVANIDELPLPDYALFDARKVMNTTQAAAGGACLRRTPAAPILTSRGCPFRCCFCAGFIGLGRKMRYRSPENVMRELDMLVLDYGVKEIIFQDDEMYANLPRARKIIELIKSRKYDLIWKNMNLASWRMDYDLLKLMKESGCYQMTISPESSNPRVLREIIHKPASNAKALEISKWCRELGIELQADFILGFPGETWAEIRDTTNFAEELDADSIKFACATPFPGTELHRKAVELGYIKENLDFYANDYLGFANPVFDTEHFTRQELKILRCMEWDRINFKTPEKTRRYMKLNGMTEQEVEEFRKRTRRTIGIYFHDEVEADRGEGLNQVRLDAMRSGAAKLDRIDFSADDLWR